MPGRSLQFFIGILIIVVSMLFMFSLVNPIEAGRQSVDRQIISTLSGEASGSAHCFKPISRYYQEDPHTIYNARGMMSFEGYYCLK